MIAKLTGKARSDAVAALKKWKDWYAKNKESLSQK